MRNLAVRAVYIWLALLTFFAVFAATAGAREALASRTQAVRQTLAATTPLTRTITVASTWNDVQGALSSVVINGPTPTVTPATISAIGGQLRADFNQGVVSLAPAGTDLASMTSGLYPVQGDLPGTGGTPVKIYVTERQPFGQQMRLVAGRFPVATPAASPAPGDGSDRHPAPLILQALLTRQTAARLGLHTGSKFMFTGPELPSTG